MIEFILFLLTGTLLYIIPGWILVDSFYGHLKLMAWEKLGLAASLSLSLYPTFFLWGSLAGIKSMAFYTLSPLMTAVIIFLFRSFIRKPDVIKSILRNTLFYARDKMEIPDPELKKGGEKIGRKEKDDHKKEWTFHSLYSLVIFSLFLSRWLAIGGMLAPSWGDSVHHTLIVKLILDNRGLFKSWAPYAPLESLTYHFGLHSDVACWAWLTGLAAHKALLLAGQFLNALAVISLFPLALKITKEKYIALYTVAIAGLFFPFPGYFVNWGRYTQLAGLVIFPGIIWLMEKILEGNRESGGERKNKDMVNIFIFALFLGGLFLTHYSMFFLALTAFSAWLIYEWGQARLKLKPLIKPIREVILAHILMLILIFPWILGLKQGRLFESFLFSSSGTKALWQKIGSNFGLWKHLDFYFSDFYWIAALISLGIGIFFWRRLAILILLWESIALLLANFQPAFFGARNLMTNDFLIFCLYIPISLLLGMAIFWLLRYLENQLSFLNLAEVRRKWISPILISVLIGLIFFGLRSQVRIVDPFFQMVTTEDLEAFKWIRGNTPRKAKFLINGFLIYGETAAAGSDAGWWLPYFTGRQVLIPPLVYNIESLNPGLDRNELVYLIKKIREADGESARLKKVLQESGYNFIFLGEKRGKVAYEDGELIREEWLRGKKEFRLLFKRGKAQVWQVVK